MDDKVVSKPAGDLATLLHARDEDHTARNVSGLVIRGMYITRR
jgi:hypothetical protein